MRHPCCIMHFIVHLIAKNVKLLPLHSVDYVKIVNI